VRIVVHPATDLPYASMVLDGFAQVLGAGGVRYSTAGFPGWYRIGRTMAFYLEDDPAARGFLSFTDQPIVHPIGRAWARVHCAVNVDEDAAGGGVLPLGPAFGVRLRSPALTARHVAATWRWAGVRGARDALERTRLVARHERRRTVIDAYRPVASDPDYVFYVAWPWAKHAEVNPPRAQFVAACRRAPGLTFEGGFAPRRRADVPEVLELSAPRRYGIREYLARVGRSAVAFNNPAVHGCLGWKLGEFLALGKATISLPVTRALPAPLEHGVHLHVVDGSPEAFDDALARLRTDHRYRCSLEVNARQWYEEHLAPAALARRLLGLLRR
jgi:hypothetical protein